MKIRKLFFIVLLSLPSCLNAQNLITGYVINDSNEPVEFANVFLTDNDGFVIVGTITNKGGQFQLEHKEKNDFKISVSHIGYEIWSKSFSNKENIELGAIKLTQNTELEEVIISSRKKVISKVGNKLVFNVENSKEVSGLDGLETIKFAPRIDPTSDCPHIFGKDQTLIYINGRPSNQPTASICKYLSTLRSDQIKKIEVITTTSAKLDAEGNKAIINVVLKENANIGFDGSTSIHYNQRTYPTYWPSTSLTYSTKKLSTSLNTAYFDEKQNNQLTNNFLFDEAYRESKTNTKPHIKGFLGSLNLDYELNSKINLGARLSSNFSKNDEKTTTETSFKNVVSQSIDSTFALPTNGNINYKYNALSVYGDIKLDTLGSMIKVSANTLRRIQSDNKTLHSTMFSGNSSEVIRTESALNDSDVDYRVNSLIADVEISRPKTKWEFGGKVTLINNDSNISFFDTNSGTPVIDPNQSNNFLYDETIIATYISFDLYHWDEWFIQLGLRYENTKTKGQSITLNEINNNGYNSIFPTAYISYDPNNNNSFSLGYSTSITRPRFYSVNPFRMYVDFFSYSEGNPFLLPSYTHNIELGYILKNNLSFFVSNIFINDSYDYLTLTSESDNLQITSPQNYFDQYILGVDVRYKWSPYKWYSNSLSLNWSYSESTSAIPDITLNRLAGNGLTLSTNNVFIINQKRENKLYLSFIQNLPSTDGFVNTSNSANLTLGGVFHFFNKNLILQLQMRDVFRQQRIIAVENYQNYRYESKTYNDTRAFTCLLTYKFGNKKSKQRQRNIDHSEQNRMN